MRAVYKVYWDNGANACGTFPYVFRLPSEAEAFAKQWVEDACIDWKIDPDAEDAPYAEVLEEYVPETGKKPRKKRRR